MLEPISTSLIASALADVASASGVNIYQKIQDKISAEDEEQLEKELISSLKERINNKKIPNSALIEVIESIGEYAVESVYLSQDEIADQIGVRLSSSTNSIEIPSV